MAVAQAVTGTLNFNPTFTQVETIINAVQANFGLTAPALQYINAQGVNFGVDQLYVGAGSLASTTITLHFETATLKDPFGNTLAMLRIRELIIFNTNVTLGQDLKVYAPSSNAITWLPPVANFIPVRPGGVLRISDPLSFGGGVGQVVGATTDGLELDSGSNTVGYQILVLGNSQA